jgi:hypothetical protein
VPCSFTLEHYRELLRGAQDAGYRFAGFDAPPRSGDLLVRHDVDLSLGAALAMAELEAEVGASSTWFLMTRSVFYNLLSEEGERAIARLRKLGGRVAHHAVWPHVDLDDRFEPVVAWHNPDRAYQNAPIEGATNAMEPPWFDSVHFRSDSNQSWRAHDVAGGCPHEELARGALDWLHVNIHPEIWVYEGESMRETMESFLSADRDARYAHLRSDRIDLS